MAKRKIDVIFSLVDDFTSSFNKSIETMTAGTKKAQNAWKGVSKFGDSVAGMGKALTATVTAPLSSAVPLLRNPCSVSSLIPLPCKG